MRTYYVHTGVILLLLTFLAASGCTTSQTYTSTTAAGSPYTSTQYGFSLTMPSGWYLQNDDPSLGMLVFRQQGSDPLQWGENINIISYESQMMPSLTEVEQQREQFATQVTDSLRATFPDVALVNSSSSMVGVGGYPALTIVYTMTYQGAKKAMSTTIFTLEMTYTLTYTAYQSSYDAYLPEFQAMLNSFRHP